MALTLPTLLASAVAALTLHLLTTALYNAFFHPLSAFPGPRLAGATSWWKTWQEVFLGKNWPDVLRQVHASRGSAVVRVAPNELHFSTPEAYHEIYNNANRWDKEARLYRAFNEDESSFGFLTYREAKARKDVLAPMFSRRAISEVQDVVRELVDRLCEALARENAQGRSSDVLFAMRCFTLDTVVRYCFGRDVRATEAEAFRAPIVVAMSTVSPTFVVFRHFELLRRVVFGMPGWLTKLTNPALAGLVDLQALLGAQVKHVVENPESLTKTSHPIIYHRLLDPDLNKEQGVPSPQSLYDEAQALLFGGAESSGSTAMMGTWHIKHNPGVEKRLKAELESIWPDPKNMPRLEELEKLPYLTAVIKESLRMSPSVPYPLPRIVPSTGATISGKHIPGGTQVGMSLLFVHESPAIFEEPERFRPERWMQQNSASLEKWLVSFSRGPRSCLGQNLGMCQLYLAFAALWRRFDVELDNPTAQNLEWRECFLPAFNANHLRAFCKPVSA